MNASAVAGVGGNDGAGHTPEGGQQTNKPKRVRTGCLTCRERHLKCDEGLPICQNCRKSNRTCKRGVRLNFIDTNVRAPPFMVPTHDWNVTFLDESRDIASEYKGGLSRYGLPEDRPPPPLDSGVAFDFSASISMPTAPIPHHQSLPSIQGMLPESYHDDESALAFESQPQRDTHHQHSHSQSESTYSGSNIPAPTTSAYGHAEQSATQAPSQGREYMENPEEVLFMQVFVEEVGLWMDSFDAIKHFSELLPFHSLREPMLYNAFLACGARHLALVNAKYTEDKALHYYNTATTYLLSALQNPNRDTVICATTAVILNVYEVMCERALQRMNHIAGARALIKECGWNARATGIGAACFWLNVGMELLSCLHFNWQVAWEPDEWGVDMNFIRETEHGKEMLWTHRILYIVAKIANFRASVPRQQDVSPQVEQQRLQNRYNEWKRLKDLADSWNDNIPRTMHPMAYISSYQTMSGSNFPEVWLIKRVTIVARLFYHTALVLLAQVNPIAPVEHSEEMRELQRTHSALICGIVAHVKDRGVASVAIRSLAIASECVSSRREQEEIVRIFSKIGQETGWRIAFVIKGLKQKWGWSEDESAGQQPQQAQPHPAQVMQRPPQPQHHAQTQLSPLDPATVQPHPMQAYPQVGVPHPATASRPVGSMPQQTLAQPRNPLLAAADFSMPQHPYQSYYVAPNPITPHSHFTY